MAVADIERQARYLAKENRDADPELTNIFWFADDSEVRLVEVLPTIPISGEETLQPFYFRPSPQHDLPAPSGIALIRPEDVRHVKLPKSWGDWTSAIELEDE